jgi:hypothetical protein
LGFDPQASEILLHRPRLPSFLNEATIRNLRLGNDSADLILRRYGDEVAVNVLERNGPVSVRVVL